MRLRPDWRRSWTKVPGLSLAEINGLTAELQTQRQWTKQTIRQRRAVAGKLENSSFLSHISHQSGSKQVKMARVTIPEQPERF